MLLGACRLGRNTRRSASNELARRMDPVLGLLDEHPLCVYATGSYGRLEGWSGSDIDLFFLYDNQDETERLPWTTFVQLASHLIRTTDDMGFPPFSGDGRYLDVQYVGEMEEVLGSPSDDSLNAFTARMLLLLESQPVTGSEVYKALLKRIVGFYYRDYSDHAETFLPTFLINDILRFWRTLTLNYEHHRLKLRALTDEELLHKKADSALKNYKLKVSRLSTCFSMIAHLSTREPPVKSSDVLDLCGMTPSQRFEALRSYGDVDGLIDELTGLYGEFLNTVQRNEQQLLEEFSDEHIRTTANERARRYGDLIYKLLGELVPDARMRCLVI